MNKQEAQALLALVDVAIKALGLRAVTELDGASVTRGVRKLRAMMEGEEDGDDHA